MSYNAPPPPPGGNYGAPQPAYGGQPQQTSVMSIISLVTGILGICCAGWFILSIAAVVLGFLAKKEIAAGKKGGGMATAGIVLGVIGILLGVLSWILIATGTLDFDYYSDLN